MGIEDNKNISCTINYVQFNDNNKGSINISKVDNKQQSIVVDRGTVREKISNLSSDNLITLAVQGELNIENVPHKDNNEENVK